MIDEQQSEREHGTAAAGVPATPEASPSPRAGATDGANGRGRAVPFLRAQGHAFATILSPRELAVLERLANGLPNRDIARELEITVNTVKFHLASIYRKLGVENRTEASVAFVRQYADTAPDVAAKGL